MRRLLLLTTNTGTGAAAAGEGNSLAVHVVVGLLPESAAAEANVGSVARQNSLVHDAKVDRDTTINVVGAAPRAVTATLDGEVAGLGLARLAGQSLDGERDILGRRWAEDARGGHLGAVSPTLVPWQVLGVVGEDDLAGELGLEGRALEVVLVCMYNVCMHECMPRRGLGVEGREGLGLGLHIAGHFLPGRRRRGLQTPSRRPE